MRGLEIPALFYASDLIGPLPVAIRSCGETMIEKLVQSPKGLMDLVHDLVHNATMQVNIHQTKTHLSKLLQKVAAGEEIIIAKAGVPIAKLVPIVAENAKRQLGLYRGQIWMAPDFDGPLPDDVLASFYGDEPSAILKKPVSRESKKSGSQKRKR